jgi:hypothetical protein
MKKHLKIMRISIISGILLFSIFTLVPIPDKTASAALVQFHSYMDFKYDTTALDQPLEIDVSVTVPITVEYWTDIPQFFRKAVPYPLNYLFLFGSPIGPMQTVRLEILDPPEWANIYISSPDVITEIPFDGEGRVEIQTDLILSPKVEAPAEPSKIDIKGSCGKIRRLSGYNHQESIEFTPSFIPTIQIMPEESIRTVGPHESVNFNIKIYNAGNKITRVTPSLINVDNDWTPTINPPRFEIQPNQESTFTFSVIAPFDFGWHNEYGRFEIEFLSEVYPYRGNSPTSTDSIYLVVNNYGFSTPGFEFAILIFAFIAICLIIKKRRTS